MGWQTDCGERVEFRRQQPGRAGPSRYQRQGQGGQLPLQPILCHRPLQDTQPRQGVRPDHPRKGKIGRGLVISLECWLHKERVVPLVHRVISQLASSGSVGKFRDVFSFRMDYLGNWTLCMFLESVLGVQKVPCCQFADSASS
jgi:hypothetical protein